MSQQMYRVLIADDSAAMRHRLATAVESGEDLRVVAMAGDGAEAVRLYQSLRPDVVVMDLNMPVMDGLLATQEMLKLGAAPIIILSGHAGHSLSHRASEAIQAGAAAVAAKPIGPHDPDYQRMQDELVSLVRSAASGTLPPRPTQPIIADDSPTQPVIADDAPTDSDKAVSEAPPARPARPKLPPAPPITGEIRSDTLVGVPLEIVVSFVSLFAGAIIIGIPFTQSMAGGTPAAAWLLFWVIALVLGGYGAGQLFFTWRRLWRTRRLVTHGVPVPLYLALETRRPERNRPEELCAYLWPEDASRHDRCAASYVVRTPIWGWESLASIDSVQYFAEGFEPINCWIYLDPRWGGEPVLQTESGLLIAKERIAGSLAISVQIRR